MILANGDDVMSVNVCLLFRFNRLLYSHRYVGSGMHSVWNECWTSTFPRIHSWGTVGTHIQVRRGGRDWCDDDNGRYRLTSVGMYIMALSHSELLVLPIPFVIVQSAPIKHLNRTLVEIIVPIQSQLNYREWTLRESIYYSNSYRYINREATSCIL